MCACVLSLFLISRHPPPPIKAAMALDCHALVNKATVSGGKFPQEVRHRIADFVCGKPSMIPRDILDSCRNGRTILDAWPAVHGWDLKETFELESDYVGGRVIRFYCIRTVLTVNLKTDLASLQFLVGKEIGGVMRVDREGSIICGEVSQWVADAVDDGLLTSLYIEALCGRDRDPSPAEFAANGCDPSATMSIQTGLALAREREEQSVVEDDDGEWRRMLEEEAVYMLASQRG